MWELRGWSGWKLAVFPCLEILLFLSSPFLWVHPLSVYPPGRVALFLLFLPPLLRLPSPPSGFCFFFSSHSPKSRVQDLLGPLNALFLRGLWKSALPSFLFYGWWGCGAQERERCCVERQVLRVILIPMDSAQRVKDANLKKAKRVSPFVPGFSALRELLDKTMAKNNLNRSAHRRSGRG